MEFAIANISGDGEKWANAWRSMKKFSFELNGSSETIQIQG